MEESECDGQICSFLWNGGFIILSVYELPGRSTVGDSVLADGNVDAAGSGNRVFMISRMWQWKSWIPALVLPVSAVVFLWDM